MQNRLRHIVEARPSFRASLLDRFSILTTIMLFPQILPHVTPTIVETHLCSTWKLHSGTRKDEIERPLQYSHNDENDEKIKNEDVKAPDWHR